MCQVVSGAVVEFDVFACAVRDDDLSVANPEGDVAFGVGRRVFHFARKNYNPADVGFVVGDEVAPVPVGVNEKVVALAAGQGVFAEPAPPSIVSSE